MFQANTFKCWVAATGLNIILVGREMRKYFGVTVLEARECGECESESLFACI